MTETTDKGLRPGPLPATEIPGLDIGQAMLVLRRGHRVARHGWNGAGMWLQLHVPDAQSTMGRPYVFISPPDGILVPWVCSQTDLLTKDYFIV